MEELKKLRAAEESAMTALVDEEMTARFSGDVTLTVRDTPTVLSPEQVRPFGLFDYSLPSTFAVPRTRSHHSCNLL